MPALASAFTVSASRSSSVIAALESLRSISAVGSPARRTLTPERLEVAYEAAFLRVFTQWEVFLEECTIRYMCGYSHVAYTPTYPASGGKKRTLTEARADLLNNRPFALWHDTQRNADRVAKWLTNSPVEQVMRTSSAVLDPMSAVRHRIAHASDDAKQKFDAAALALAGQRFGGGSVGRFLRGKNPGQPQTRYVDLVAILSALARQIAS